MTGFKFQNFNIFPVAIVFICLCSNSRSKESKDFHVVNFAEVCSEFHDVVCDVSKGLICSKEEVCDCDYGLTYSESLDKCIKITDSLDNSEEEFCSKDDPDCINYDKLKNKHHWMKDLLEDERKLEGNKNRAGWKRRFSDHDIGNKGYLTKKELAKFLNEDWKLNSQLELNLHFWYIDLDENDKIEQSEYFEAMMSSYDELEKTFYQHRKGNSLCIYKEDLDWASDNIEVEFLEIDTDSDGCATVLEYGVFLWRFAVIGLAKSKKGMILSIDDLHGLEEKQTPQRTLLPRKGFQRKTFDMFDVDKNGILDNFEQSVLFDMIKQYIKIVAVKHVMSDDVEFINGRVSYENFYESLSRAMAAEDFVDHPTAKNLTAIDRTDVYFKLYDENKDGFLDYDEMYEVLLFLHEQVDKNDEDLQALFLAVKALKGFDIFINKIKLEIKSNDWKLNLQEFQLYIKDLSCEDNSDFVVWMKGKDSEITIRLLFKKMDLNEDGLITKGEVYQEISDMPKAIEVTKVMKRWDQFDLNNDGLITLTEFLAYDWA